MATSTEIVKINLKNYNYSFDLDYLLNIVNTLSFSELETIICQLLISKERETISETCFAIRDLMVCGHRHSEFTEFREKYPQSLIVKTVESLLYSGDRYSVGDAIYTLGKTCSYSSIDALNQAFYHLKDTDPILLPRLFFEMTWLGLENYWELIDCMMSSDIYFTRWAVINLLPTFIDEGEKEKHILLQDKYRHLEILQQDSNQFIRVEAEYKCRFLEFERTAKTLPKKERKKLRKTLEKEEQLMFDFDYLSMAFDNYLYSKKLYSYTISELETFVNYFSFFTDRYRNPLLFKP